MKITHRKSQIQHYLTLIAVMLAGFAAGVLVLPYLRAGEIYDYQDTVDGVHLPEADAIVCLAGGRGRITAAGDFWYRYWEAQKHGEKIRIPKLYISGMGHKADMSVLRRQLRTGVQAVLQASDVMIENESYNTETNARWLSTSLKTQKWQKIILVTSPYHMKRAHMIFQRSLERLGLNVQIETLSAFQEPFEPGEWRNSLHGIHVTLMEYFKWIYYRYFWTALE